MSLTARTATFPRWTNWYNSLLPTYAMPYAIPSTDPLCYCYQGNIVEDRLKEYNESNATMNLVHNSAICLHLCSCRYQTLPSFSAHYDGGGRNWYCSLVVVDGEIWYHRTDTLYCTWCLPGVV
eukprot:2300262-Rhodomonas_salina.2